MNESPSQLPSQSLWQISSHWLEHSGVRKEYREERESEMSALLGSYQAAENSAVAIAQSVIKSCFLLNGGGIIALPAIVTLLNLDPEKFFTQLMVTCALFTGGLLVAGLGGIAAFFTLSHKSDYFYQLAVEKARHLEGKYFPDQLKEMAKQSCDAEQRARRLRIWWVCERYASFLLCIVSVLLFVVGGFVGGVAILKAPHKPPLTMYVQPQR